MSSRSFLPISKIAVLINNHRLIRNSIALCLLLALLALGVGVVGSSSIGTNTPQAAGLKMAPTLHPHQIIPTISIVSVEQGRTVTFRTNNYPPNQTFTVYMGKMYTRGIGGEKVGTFESGSGGSFEVTMEIPESLKGDAQIAIRAQTAHKHPYFSYNWYYNVGDQVDENKEEEGMTGGGEDPETSPAPTVYKGIPTFKICSVEKDSTVTLLTNNFPPNQTFTVTMGKMHTRGIRGTEVGTIESGEGGALNVTLDIPDNLKGHGRISIRLQTAHKHPFFAYNWFYNNTASVC